MSFTQILGWSSTAILLATITSQIHRQYRAHDVTGVSPWLFVGQIVASSGLLVYSILKETWVFVVLNIAMGTAAVVGLLIWFRFASAKDRKANALRRN